MGRTDGHVMMTVTMRLPAAADRYRAPYTRRPHSRELGVISYTTVGTNDLDRATAFYDDLLGMLGARRAMSFPRGHVWGRGDGQAMFGVLTPFDGKPATSGNGAMITLSCNATVQVDALHARALALGGRDEGAPGLRFDGFYAAYCRDLDGNKLCFCKLG